jgi:quercetin dioxygenase-like cupin family protein
VKRKITHPVFRDVAFFVRTASETNHAFAEIEITLMPGGGNPLHRHLSFTETFKAVEGNLAIKGGFFKKRVLKPGEAYTVKMGEAHSFYNATNKEIRFIITIEPGHEGFENSLRIIYGLADDGKTKIKSWRDLLIAALVMDMGDMRWTGPLSLLNPFIKRLAQKAKRKGIEQELLQVYVFS